MHYKDGTRAKLFDRALVPVYDSATEQYVTREALLVGLDEKSTCCNLYALVDAQPAGLANGLPAPGKSSVGLAFLSGSSTYVDAKQCELVERVKDPPAETPVGTGG